MSINDNNNDGLFPGTNGDSTDLDRYLGRVTGAHNQMPRFMQTVALSVQSSVDALPIARVLALLFDIDYAVGDQLDATGRWIGIARHIAVDFPTDAFSLDIFGLGLDEARWYGSETEHGGHITLDDDEYRLVLQTRILANMWDGLRGSAYDVLTHYFAAKGFELAINDNYAHGTGWFTFDDPNPGLGFDQGYWDQTPVEDIHPGTGNMWMDLILFGDEFPPLIRALFAGGYFDIKPAGVGIEYWHNDPEFVMRWDEFTWDYGIWELDPMFGWDLGPTQEEVEAGGELTFGHPPFGGWDISPWALQVTPIRHSGAVSR